MPVVLLKLKQKNCKYTDTRSTVVGERLFLDITGPFAPSLAGSKYWVQIANDATRMGFCYFMKQKSEIGDKLSRYIEQTKLYQRTPKIIHCDNSKENLKHFEDVAQQLQMQMEYTSPYTPQYNGVVEHQIAVLKIKSQAMLKQARLQKSLHNSL